MSTNKKIKNKSLQKQLHVIIGQANALGKMFNSDRKTIDIIIQLKALQSGIQKLINAFTAEEIKVELNQLVTKALDECPGECPTCEQQEAIKRNIDLLDLEALTNYSEKLKTSKKKGK
jgi:DNA-binding FrmR family transcriptional regulator